MIIRKATLDDAPYIAAHLLLAMEDIVYQFIGTVDREKALAFLHYFAERENNQYSYQNCWVCTDSGAVVGTINVYDGGRIAELRAPVVGYIRSRYNPHFEPEAETGPGEFYIDSIGVIPGMQGQGIGRKLLQTVKAIYVEQQGATLGLLVDSANPLARKLYPQLGFQPAGTRILFGKEMEHLQLRT